MESVIDGTGEPRFFLGAKGPVLPFSIFWARLSVAGGCLPFPRALPAKNSWLWKRCHIGLLFLALAARFG